MCAIFVISENMDPHKCQRVSYTAIHGWSLFRKVDFCLKRKDTPARNNADNFIRCKFIIVIVIVSKYYKN